MGPVPVDDLVGKTLAGYGLLGAVCAGLLVVIRTLWRKIQDLETKLDTVQKERLTELRNNYTALADANSALDKVAAGRRLR